MAGAPSSKKSKSSSSHHSKDHEHSVTKVKKKTGPKTGHSRSYPRGVGLDFRKLAGLTLIGYIDHHGVKVRPEAPPSELAVAVARHFEQMEVDEEEVIGGLLERLEEGPTVATEYSRKTQRYPLGMYGAGGFIRGPGSIGPGGMPLHGMPPSPAAAAAHAAAAAAAAASGSSSDAARKAAAHAAAVAAATKKGGKGKDGKPLPIGKDGKPLPIGKDGKPIIGTIPPPDHHPSMVAGDAPSNPLAGRNLLGPNMDIATLNASHARSINRKRTKWAARPGEQVAAKVTRTDENGSWILASVQRFYVDTETYDVQDEDDTSKLIRLPWSHVMRLSTGAEGCFVKGADCMAIFPETTSFYKSKVALSPVWKLDHGVPCVKEIVVQFDDDEDAVTGKTPKRRVPSRYVIPTPQAYFYDEHEDVDLVSPVLSNRSTSIHGGGGGIFTSTASLIPSPVSSTTTTTTTAITPISSTVINTPIIIRPTTTTATATATTTKPTIRPSPIPPNTKSTILPIGGKTKSTKPSTTAMRSTLTSMPKSKSAAIAAAAAAANAAAKAKNGSKARKGGSSPHKSSTGKTKTKPTAYKNHHHHHTSKAGGASKLSLMKKNAVGKSAAAAAAAAAAGIVATSAGISSMKKVK